MLTRKQFIVAGTSFTFALGCSNYYKNKQRRPNIILLIADDLRWNALGCMGNIILKTPNIDFLSKNGITFDNHFVTTSICPDSRASVFTGLCKSAHKTDFHNSMARKIFERSYPVILRRNGYYSGFIGKFGIEVSGYHRGLPVEHFDYFNGFAGQGDYYKDNIFGRGQHITDAMTDSASSFIKRASKLNTPFLLSISYKAPHVEDEIKNGPKQFMYQVKFKDLYKNIVIPEISKKKKDDFINLPIELRTSEGRRRYLGKLDTYDNYQETLKNYYRLISGIDESIGKIIEDVREVGMQDNTIIIFTSDNGMMFGEHGLTEKWCMYEESIRTPLIIYNPTKDSSSAKRIKELSLNIDIAPTILSLARININKKMQGVNVMDMALGKKIVIIFITCMIGNINLFLRQRA
jgi:arylsulfatase A-like enzyme